MDDTPVSAVILTPHEGFLNYYCRKCDTHVSMTPAHLNGRDITKMCFCARGVITEDDDKVASVPKAVPVWPVKVPKKKRIQHADTVFDARELGDRVRNRKVRQTELIEAV